MNSRHEHDLADELNLDTTDSVSRFLKLLTSKFNWDNLLCDAQSLHRIFTPTRIIHNQPRNTVSYSFKEFCKSPPDAIIIMGNNDLHQVDRVAWLCKHLSSDKLPKIYISGKGGHPTTAGYCFGISEAETFAQKLIDLGLPSDHLILECNATNTGENILFANKLMMSSKHQNILIASTPAGLLRQLVSYEKQSQLPWNSISTLPSTWDEIKKNYYQQPISTVINFISLLHEATKYLHYSINKDYLTPGPIHIMTDESTNKLAIKKMLQILIKYFNHLTDKKIDASNAAKLYIDLFYNKNSSCSEKLNRIIEPILRYFHALFSMTEISWIKKIDASISLRKQTLKLYDNFNNYGLDLPTKVIGSISCNNISKRNH